MKAAEEFVVPPHVAWRRVGEGVVILDLESSIYWSLNATAARIWELLAEKTPPASIARRLSSEFDVGAGVAERDVRKAIEELAREGVLAARTGS